MFNFQSKTIIITGGTGLIGSAYSEECTMAGANVVIVDINKDKGEELANSLKEKTGNNNVIFQNCDITSIADTQSLINTTLRKFNKIDALVNSAYPRNNNYGRIYEEVDFKDFCENVNLHLGGYFLMTQQISKVMMKQKEGNIINMNSIYSFKAPKFEIYDGTNMTMPVEYAAIKGAILNLTRYLASYLGKYGIRVNAISPGGIYDNQPKSFVTKYCSHVVLGSRMTTLSDIIGLLLFLLDDSSKHITGQNIVVDGGWSL
jgi:NAD(P)-dependent dehydrogenase (short-subunit alcohol dehydrogenase family)